jgi:hypothetical protein
MLAFVAHDSRINLIHLRFQTELLRLSRTNFSESFQILVHLKVVRLFVESVLRYGLPANYVGLAIKVHVTLLFKEKTVSRPCSLIRN